MDVDENMVRHIAKVARLDLSDEEIKELTPELRDVLETFTSLQKADTGGLEPAFHPMPIPAHIREDKIEPSLSQDEALSLSSNKKDGFFKGPKTLNK